MSIEVKRESINTKAHHVALSFAAMDGKQYLVGSENNLPIEDVATLRLEEGRSFALAVINTFAVPLLATQSIDIAIAFAQGVTPNISISGLCSGNAVGSLYEGAVVTGGTPITAINKNRNFTTASQSVALSGPTVTSLGTQLLSQILIGGVGKKASGNDMASSDLILKPLTTYLFRLTNVNGVPHAAEVVLEWYE